jgi:hypothetical protein
LATPGSFASCVQLRSVDSHSEGVMRDLNARELLPAQRSNAAGQRSLRVENALPVLRDALPQQWRGLDRHRPWRGQPARLGQRGALRGHRVLLERNPHFNRTSRSVKARVHAIHRDALWRCNGVAMAYGSPHALADVSSLARLARRGARILLRGDCAAGNE